MENEWRLWKKKLFKSSQELGPENPPTTDDITVFYYFKNTRGAETGNHVTFSRQEHAQQASHGDGSEPGQKTWRRVYQVVINI